MGRDHLPDGYLDFCSLGALESLALSRMNRAALLRKELQSLLVQLVQAEAEAHIVRRTLAQRRSQDLRNGAGSQMRTAPGSLVLPTRNLFDAARASDVGYSSPPATVLETQRLPTCESACGRTGMLAAQRPQRPVRVATGREAALKPGIPKTPPAREPHPQLVSEASAFAAGKGLGRKYGRSAATGHARSVLRQLRSTKRKRHLAPPGRLVPIAAMRHDQAALRTSASGKRPTVHGLTSALRKRSVLLAGRGEHHGLFLVTSSSMKRRRIRAESKCSLASAC